MLEILNEILSHFEEIDGTYYMISRNPIGLDEVTRVPETLGELLDRLKELLEYDT